MGRRTGPKPSFNADDVVDAAFAGGLHVMTLAGVARSLGVAPQTLYRVYPSRDAVVVACLERAAATLSAPDRSPSCGRPSGRRAGPWRTRRG